MDVKLTAGSYFGNRVQGRELAGFLLTDYAYRPGERLRMHYHERSYFCLVVAGGYAETYGNRQRECRTATLVFHPAGERHAEHIGGSGARVFSVEAGTHWLREAPEYRAALDTPADFQGGLLSRLAFRLYREFCRPDACSPLAVEGLVLELVAERVRRTPHGTGQDPGWLVRAREVLHDRFTSPPSLGGLAQEVGIHPVHLARTFRTRLGCSVGEYVRQRRVDYACRQLVASDMPLVEIALAAGFADQSHFARTFKRLRGLTPGEFRHLHRSR
jgi:AraC family transcriptional regulator